MKIKDTFLLGILAVAGFSSCVSEDINSELAKVGQGQMALNVDLQKPAATRATSEVTNFPVIVYDADGNEVKSYNTVADVPTAVPFAVGNYVVKSHTPGDIAKRMTAPYYSGSEDMEIMAGVTTDVDVTCTMENSSIKVLYASDFSSVFTSWTVTIDDGSNTALSFTENEGLTPDIVYWLFENQVTQLKMNFRGTTQNGSTVSATNTLTKSQAQESYDNDKTYFSGGDAIIITISVVESTEGEVTGINIGASVTFEEDEETVTIETTDDGTLTPVNPGGGSTGGDDQDAITLTLPAPISYAFLGASTVDKSIGDTDISATKGLKSIIVKLESTSQDMITSVNDLNTNYGVDFINGAEIVGNQSVVTLFNDLNQPLSVPAEGDTNYTFPIGNFFELLQVLTGEHTFNLTVTDMEGNTKSGSVTITITQ